MSPRQRVTYDPRQDYYDVLGVAPHANLATIQQAYRQQAKAVHPDLNPDRLEWAKARFQLVNEAYSVLSDVEARQTYDNLRWRHQFGASRPVSSSRGYAYRPPPRPRSDASRYARQQPSPAPEPGAWLQAIGLGFLQPLYVGLVALVGSPYRYVLFVVGVVVLLNTVFIVAGLGLLQDSLFDVDATVTPEPTVTLAPGESVPLPSPEGTVVGGLVPTSTQVPAAAPTADCDPRATFHLPRPAIIGTGGFTHIRGTVNHPQLRTYEVTADYLGQLPDGPVVSRYTLKPAREAAREAPVQEDILAELEPLYALQGYYRLNLHVELLDGRMLPTCSVVIR